MGENPIDLSVLHDAIVAAIGEGLEGVASIVAYARAKEKLQSPAVALELEDIEPDEDDGSGRLAAKLRWSAHVVWSFKHDEVKQGVRIMAVNLALLIHQNRFGQPIGPARVLSVGPDVFSPENEVYETWQVQWEHVVYLGKSSFDFDGVVPQELWFSTVPEIGTPHEPDYEQLELK